MESVFLYLPGGWWAVKSFMEINGTVALEMQNKAYVHALDSGLFTLGAPHKGEMIQWRWSLCEPDVYSIM